MLTKNSEPNRIYILSELEKHAERENSFGGKYNNIDELNKFCELSTDSSPKFSQDPSSCTFSEFKVINRFKVKEQGSSGEKYKNGQHGRSHKRYSIVFDAFQSLFQTLNATFWSSNRPRLKVINSMLTS